MVGLIEIKATQPSWGLGLAELGNNNYCFLTSLMGEKCSGENKAVLFLWEMMTDND